MNDEFKVLERFEGSVEAIGAIEDDCIQVRTVGAGVITSVG